MQIERKNLLSHEINEIYVLDLFEYFSILKTSNNMNVFIINKMILTTMKKHLNSANCRIFFFSIMKIYFHFPKKLIQILFTNNKSMRVIISMMNITTRSTMSIILFLC